MTTHQSLAKFAQLAATGVDPAADQGINSYMLRHVPGVFSRYDSVLVHQNLFAYDHRMCTHREGDTYAGTGARPVTFRLVEGDHTGDLVRSLHLVTSWPGISANLMAPGDNVGLVHYVWGLGYSCFSHVEVSIGPTYRERFSSAFMEAASELRPPLFDAMRDEFSAPAGARMREMTFKWDAATPHSLAGLSSRPFTLYTWVDIPWTRTPGHALPFVALGNSTVELTFHMADLADTVAMLPNSYLGWGGLDDRVPPGLSYASVDVNLLVGWIHLNIDEARFVAAADHHYTARHMTTPMGWTGHNPLRFAEGEDKFILRNNAGKFPISSMHFAIADANRASLKTSSDDSVRFPGGVRALMGSVVSPTNLTTLDDGCLGHARTLAYCDDAIDGIVATPVPGAAPLVVGGPSGGDPVAAHCVRLAHDPAAPANFDVRAVEVTLSGFEQTISHQSERTVFRVYVCPRADLLPASPALWFTEATKPLWQGVAGGASDANAVALVDGHEAEQTFRFPFERDAARVGPVESVVAAVAPDKAHWGVAGDIDHLTFDDPEHVRVVPSEVFRNRMFSEYKKVGVHANPSGTAQLRGLGHPMPMLAGVEAEDTVEQEIPLAAVLVGMDMVGDGARIGVTEPAMHAMATAQYTATTWAVDSAHVVRARGVGADAVHNLADRAGLSPADAAFFDGVGFHFLENVALPGRVLVPPVGLDSLYGWTQLADNPVGPGEHEVLRTDALANFSGRTVFLPEQVALEDANRPKTRPVVAAHDVTDDVVAFPLLAAVANAKEGGVRTLETLFTSSPHMGAGDTVQPSAAALSFSNVTVSTGDPGVDEDHADDPAVSVWMYTQPVTDPVLNPGADNSGIPNLYLDTTGWHRVADLDPALFDAYGAVDDVFIDNVDLGGVAPPLAAGQAIAFAVAPTTVSGVPDTLNIAATGAATIVAELHCTAVRTIQHGFSADVKRYCADSGAGPWLPRNRYDYRLADDAGVEVEPLKSLQIQLDGNNRWTEDQIHPGAFFRLVQPLEHYNCATLRKGLYSLNFGGDHTLHHVASLGSDLNLTGHALADFEFTASRPSTATTPLELVLWFEHHQIYKVSGGTLKALFNE